MVGLRERVALTLACLGLTIPAVAAQAQQPAANSDSRPADSTSATTTILRPASSRRASSRPLLTAEQWRRLDRAVDRGLAFLATTQRADGSFRTAPVAQSGITSLAVMAFLSRGHQPGKGRYGALIERAIDYVLGSQDPRSGVIYPDRSVRDNESTHYCHGISGVMLAEVYGMTDAARHERIREAVVQALDYTRRQQLRPKRFFEERGGWRYMMNGSNSNESDLSITAWQLMFYRAARNAEFNVPEKWVNEALAYVHRSFDANERGFVYCLSGGNRYVSRAMVGAGVVSLALAGEHRSETAKAAGEWILRTPFEPYNRASRSDDRFHYGAFYCSQAMFQLGGDDWHRFFPRLLDVLAQAQHQDGSWDIEAAAEDAQFGNIYTSALAILALTPPYQLLPIYQR